MSAVDDLGGSDHPARRLCDALEPAVAGRARAREIAFARRNAQAADLPGLDHLLAALEPHAGRPWPREVEPALERVRRLCARARDAGTLEGFQTSDRELEGLAGELEAYDWSAPRPAAGVAPRPTVPTLSVAVALADLPLDEASQAVASRVRLAPPVAAALRAALDWMSGADADRPLHLETGDSFLEVTVEAVDTAGIAPATDVLAAVQANLSPLDERVAGPDAGPAWRIRVPTFAERACFLMVLQESVRLAIPWHAVLRLVMGDRLAASSPDARVPRLGASRGSERAPQKPLVLIAHGRTRAWLAADRMVWRLPADAIEPPGPAPWPGIRDAVRTEDGETWWIAEPGWLLSTVEPPPLPPARSHRVVGKPRAAKPSTPTAPERAESEELPPSQSSKSEVDDSRNVEAPSERDEEGSPVSTVARDEEIPELGEADVEPLASEPVKIAPAPTIELPRVEPAPRRETPPRSDAAEKRPASSRMEPLVPRSTARPLEPARAPRTPGSTSPPAPATPSAPAPKRPDAPRSTPRGRRTALVAEDSITARIFLTRLLEQQGFEVRAVDTAAALRSALGETWGIVFVDVELPDGRGAGYLRDLPGRDAGAWIAMVRDDADGEAAREAGFERTLRKPVEREALERVLTRAGFGRRA